MENDIKIMNEQSKCKRYCEHCGHTISFYAFEKDTKICRWCGNKNYRNESIKFKDILTKKIKKVKV